MKTVWHSFWHIKKPHLLEIKNWCGFRNVCWCPEEDSNLHTLRHTDLNRARLPIPPSGPRLAEGAQFNS